MHRAEILIGVVWRKWSVYLTDWDEIKQFFSLKNVVDDQMILYINLKLMITENRNKKREMYHFWLW